MSVATINEHTHVLARIGHALSEPTRAGILLILRRGDAYPSDLAEQLAVSKQVMSNQLRCLKGCGLVDAVPQGRRTRYRLKQPELAGALDALLELSLVVEPGCCSGAECTC